jgi:hypothetical protein
MLGIYMAKQLLASQGLSSMELVSLEYLQFRLNSMHTFIIKELINNQTRKPAGRTKLVPYFDCRYVNDRVQNNFSSQYKRMITAVPYCLGANELED